MKNISNHDLEWGLAEIISEQPEIDATELAELILVLASTQVEEKAYPYSAAPRSSWRRTRGFYASCAASLAILALGMFFWFDRDQPEKWHFDQAVSVLHEGEWALQSHAEAGDLILADHKSASAQGPMGESWRLEKNAALSIGGHRKDNEQTTLKLLGGRFEILDSGPETGVVLVQAGEEVLKFSQQARASLAIFDQQGERQMNRRSAQLAIGAIMAANLIVTPMRGETRQLKTDQELALAQEWVLPLGPEKETELSKKVDKLVNLLFGIRPQDEPNFPMYKYEDSTRELITLAKVSPSNAQLIFGRIRQRCKNFDFRAGGSHITERVVSCLHADPKTETTKTLDELFKRHPTHFGNNALLVLGQRKSRGAEALILKKVKAAPTDTSVTYLALHAARRGHKDAGKNLEFAFDTRRLDVGGADLKLAGAAGLTLLGQSDYWKKAYYDVKSEVDRAFGQKDLRRARWLVVRFAFFDQVVKKQAVDLVAMSQPVVRFSKEILPQLKSEAALKTYFSKLRPN